MNAPSREVHHKPNILLNLYKCTTHFDAWKPELANVHQQHVEARLNYVYRISTSSTEKGTQRRQVADCFWRVRAHTHTFSGADSCADVAARESCGDKMFALQETHTHTQTLSTVCVRVS